MKKGLLLFCVLLLLFTFGACRGREDPAPSTQPPETGTADEQAAPLRLRVISGAGTGQLILAGENAGDLYTANTEGLTVFLDGEPAAADVLQNGMRLTTGPDYTVLETWPGQLTDAALYAESADDGEDPGDLCGLYLRVLEDLWAEDEGLNDNAQYISVDLGEAPGGLTDGEKAAVAWIFAGRHNAQSLTLSYEALRENGFLDGDVSPYYWEDGALFSIKGTGEGDRITFTAEKWRSGTGAIFFIDCTASRGRDLQWKDYKPGSFAIA